MKPIHFSKASYEDFEVNGIAALFTNIRIERESLPEGVYAYDIRESDDGERLATIESQVCVNHGGTILVLEEIPMPEIGYLKISDYSYGLGREISLEEWREALDKPTTGILPQGKSLLNELTNGLFEIYENTLCPECENSLNYELDDAPVGKGIIEQYVCSDCGYTCSPDKYNDIEYKFAERWFNQSCKAVCDKFNVNYYKIVTNGKSPFKVFKDEIMDIIAERIPKRS